MALRSCERCGQVFNLDEGYREYQAHTCEERVGAAQWKDLTPRRRTGSFLRVRRDGKVVR